MNITKAEFLASNSDVNACPQNPLPEYAFIGRSNVGKSSLINMLTQKKHLAKTSQKPGKTQLINHFIINDEWFLVDLPGYGYAQRGKQGRENIRQIIENYILQRQALTNLFLLIDSRLEPQKIDLNFINWLGENHVPFTIVFTKIDKISKAKLLNNMQIYTEKLNENWEQLPPIISSSAENQQGRNEILDLIQQINDSLKQ